MASLPDEESAYWFSSTKKSDYPTLNYELEADVAIIGGGITGLTAAYLIKRSGLKVVVLEKARIGSGTTGRTTGKVTSQHSLIYADFQKRLGEKTARLYGEANQVAVEQIAKIVQEAKIDCDWHRDDNYVYTTDPDQVKKFRQEAETAGRLGLPASFETKTLLPFDIKAAVKFTGQGKFNSEKYVQGLAKAINGQGSYVFEHSNVTGIRDGSPCRFRTKRGKIFAKNAIVATNVPTLPLAARGAFCMLEYPTESYIVLGRPSMDLRGMYISPDSDNYSILPIQNNGERLILIGGEGHLSTFHVSSKKRYQKLADYAERNFGVTEILNKWADRDYQTYDGPPLIGLLYPWSKHLYVASAFRKWGLSNGTVAGMVLRDFITEQPNPWAEIFSSSRFKPIANVPRVAAQYILRRN